MADSALTSERQLKEIIDPHGEMRDKVRQHTLGMRCDTLDEERARRLTAALPLYLFLLMLQMRQVAKAVRDAHRITFITGAGLSTACGIRDYRSGANTILKTGQVSQPHCASGSAAAGACNWRADRTPFVY